MIRLIAIMMTCFQPSLSTSDEGVFPKALWFLQTYGQVDGSLAKQDHHLKSALAKALANDRELSLDELEELIRPELFHKFAGTDQRLTVSEISAALEMAVPPARLRLLPDLRSHADWLTTTFDMIEPGRYQSMDQLSDWIAANTQNDRTLHVLMTCTGNSRRSIFSAAMGNLAAAYYGFDNVRFHSGGTLASAFNPRTIAALKDIGFQIEPTGEEAERGDPRISNPVYRVKWGEKLEATEFSKSYKHPANPQTGFAAVMVCTEADADCPVVEGAALRVSMPFLDPKVYDDGRYESRKYAERRDDIGRTLLAVMANARRQIQARNAEQ